MTIEALLTGKVMGLYLQLPAHQGGGDGFYEWNEEIQVLPFSDERSGSSIFMNQQQYQELVEKAIDSIRNQNFNKVVTSRKVKVAINAADGEALIQRWKDTFPNAYLFVIQHPQWGLWLGASPELLAFQSNGKLKTMALAGSKSIDDDSHWTEKEKEEHQVVVRMITQTLDDMGDVNRVVSSPIEVAMNSVKHLQTNIETEVKVPFREVVDHLHPTPALCGWPVQPAKRWIVENEGYDRELYGGVLKVRKEGKDWAIVLLRCIKIESNEAFAFVGGGIMENSDANNEWKETQWKLKSFTFAADEDLG